MARSCKKHETGCPIAFALDAFGDRWSLLVVRDLMLGGKKTYGEFLADDEGIATNILADRLKQLEAQGIINKARDPENGRRFIYGLTEKGRDLVPVIMELVRWSGRYDPKTAAPADLLERMEADRDGMIDALYRHMDGDTTALFPGGDCPAG